jgi:MraZ protein
VAGKALSGYSGQGFSPRGEKGRYVLPPAFRNAIAPEQGDPRTLCLARHDRWNCLTGFGLSRTERFEAQLDREEESALRLGREFDRELRSIQLWTFSEIPFDASGRFVLPEHLGELCGIDGAICFLGAGQFFTLWAPKQLYAMGQGWEGQQAVCGKLEADAATKGKRK